MNGNDLDNAVPMREEGSIMELTICQNPQHIEEVTIEFNLECLYTGAHCPPYLLLSHVGPTCVAYIDKTLTCFFTEPVIGLDPSRRGHPHVLHVYAAPRAPRGFRTLSQLLSSQARARCHAAWTFECSARKFSDAAV
jgi:hypothetical protein